MVYGDFFSGLFLRVVVRLVFKCNDERLVDVSSEDVLG